MSNEYRNDSAGGLERPVGFYTSPDYSESNYVTVLQSIHKNLKPDRYIEIGTQAGVTLALAECASLAIDPHFTIDRDVVGNKPSCLLYQMTSDRFFSNYDPNAILGGPADLVFLDGMHWFEYLLRDFSHMEKYVKRHSVILLHDCMPTDTHIARRDIHDTSVARLSPHPGWWSGDVWKAVAILLKYRPDLFIYGCRAAPTGLIAITNLDPTSNVIEKRYFDLVDEFKEVRTDKESLDDYIGALRMVHTSEFVSWERMSRYFWLA